MGASLLGVMATVELKVNEPTRDAVDQEENRNEDEDEDGDVPNIYGNIEPDECCHLDFHSGLDMLGPSLHLRDMYDDIESMWTPSDQFDEPYTLNDLKTAFVRAAEVVGETRFSDGIVWLASGSFAESSFFSVKYQASESECRQKLFGDSYSGIGERHFQEYLKESQLKWDKPTLLWQANDYDYMLTPKSLILSHTDCVVRKTDTPGFLKVELLNSDITDTWADCCFKQTTDQCNQVFVSPTKVKKKLERILIQLEKEGPYIVKQGSVAFQIADLSNVSRGILYFDIVFAIKCTFWPSMASKWITRPRKWPSKEDIEAVVADGFHLVPKVNSSSVDHLEWRISFSRAEVSFTNLPLLHHYGIIHWRILKSLFSCCLKLEAHPKLLTSYHLKTLFWYALERIKYDHWLNKEHLLKSILGIMDDLIVCLATHNCPHYFIPEINLFDDQIPHSDFYPLVAEQVLSLRKSVSERPEKMIFGD